MNAPIVNRVLVRFVSLIATILLASLAYAARQEFALGAAPTWVTHIQADINANPPTDQVSAGIYYLLHDVQVRLEGKDRVTYRHLASKAINQKGLESLANIELRFDPSYQTLTLHAVSIHRAGKRINKLKAESVKILQRERDLEYLVYDGSKTANLLLDDVKVGDTVEYSYSVRGNNPVFHGMHAGRFDLQWTVPVHQVHVSLSAPIARVIAMTKRNLKIDPVVTEARGERTYSWTMREVAGLTVEPDAPPSYDPYSSVEWSEFADWGAVARWAAPWYQPAADGRAVGALVATIKAGNKSRGELALEALRFVQGEIRYLSVAVGAGSHAPSAPETVLQRRFGDCKDKARLLVSILTQLGVDAKVALVNTTTQGGVGDNQPSPFAFNHVIVRALIDGQVVWLDPTRRTQGGKLDSLHQYDYGYALVIDGATTALTTMFPPSKERSHSNRNISAVIDSSIGLTGPAKYTVTSTFEGGAAESLRATLSSISRDALQKQYVSFYESYFSGIQATAKFTVEDELLHNRIIVREFYDIPNFWKVSETQRLREGIVPVPDVEVLLKAPQAANRTSPLWLAYPTELLHTTEVLLPDTWQIKTKEIKIDGPGFAFERRIEHPRPNRIVLRDRVATTANEVAVASLAEYGISLAKAREAVGYVLTASVSPSDSASSVWENINGLIATLAVAMAAGWIWLGRMVYRLDPKPSYRTISPQLAGLRGWLLYVAFAFLTIPVRIGHQIWTILPSISVDSWAALTNRASETFHPLWAPLVIVELACNIGLLTLSIVLIILFFKKRSSVPNFYISFVWASLIINAADLLVTLAIPSLEESVTAKDWSTLAASTITALIWSAYFKRSKRVRSTFVETYAPAEDTLVQPSAKFDLRQRAFVDGGGEHRRG